MLYLESFFVRRLIIGRATANINRILLAVVTEMDPAAPADEAVRAYLSTGRKYYATDAEIRAATPAIPFYLNGRPRQRALVMQWLEESYGSKEPVEFGTLTIEHVLPQTPTPEWRAMLSEDLDEPDETFEQVHAALGHTLGNLTLTGYNSAMSNSPFAVKRQQLDKSGLVMNQEIAACERWGRPEIQERAAQLADRIASAWPPPLATAPAGTGVAWDVMAKALAEIPAGSWTTYGDLAALIGSHPVAVGIRLANYPVHNAHRVLQADGTTLPLLSLARPGPHRRPKRSAPRRGRRLRRAGPCGPGAAVHRRGPGELAGVSKGESQDPVAASLEEQAAELAGQFG